MPMLFRDSLIAPACRGTVGVGTVQAAQRVIHTVIVSMISNSHSTSAA